MKFLFLPLLIGLLILQACAKDEKILPAEEYFTEAMEFIEDEYYLQAQESLDKLNSYHPFSKYVEQALLESMFANYKLGDYLPAMNTADRFIRLFPDHEQIDYAYYVRGLSLYDQGRGIVQNKFKNGAVSRDLEKVKHAFKEFAIVVNNYPDSVFKGESLQYMVHIRNMLALHEVRVGQFYLDLGAYLSAANRARYVLLNFADTSSYADAQKLHEDALKHMTIESQL